MSGITKLRSDIDTRAEAFAVERWGWQQAPQEIISQAILCEKILREKLRTGDVIAELGILPPTQVGTIIRKRQEEKSSLQTLDYILEAEPNNRTLQNRQNEILAAIHGIQYFAEIPTPDIDVHELMENEEVRKWCKSTVSVLMHIQKKTPILVFSRWSKEAIAFTQMGKADLRSNPITKNLEGRVNVALSLPDFVASALSSSQNAEGSSSDNNKANVVLHREWVSDPIKSRALLANIHEYAIRNNCTDIHISPQNSGDVRVEFRIDKELKKASADLNMSMAEYHEIKNDLAFFSNAAPQRQLIMEPKDGQYTYMFGKVRVDIRAMFMPKGTEENAKQNLILIRLRLLKQEKSGPIDLSKINMKPQIIEYMRKAVRPSSGLVLMVGPTGSGKSTALLGMVNEHVQLYRHELSRLSIEDPIERYVPDLDQVQVSRQVKNHHKDPFAHYLTYMLRADPDLFLLGEIRSQETAIACANFSDTGHLVLSTLHSQSAPKAINRLANMVPDRSNLYSVINSLNYIFATRGLQKLCDNCKDVREVTEEELNDAKNELARKNELVENIPTRAAFKSKSGCSECNFKGSVGILPAIEVLEVTSEVRSIALDTDMNENLKLEKLNVLRHTTLYSEIAELISQHQVSFKNFLI